MNVIVTGGSRGIGKAIVQMFASKGHHVAFCGRNADTLEELYGELAAAYPAQSFISQPLDASDQESVSAFVEEIYTRWGTVDVLVNNAGTYIPGQISEQTFDDLDSQIKNNLYSAFFFTRAALPGMIRARSGYIFNMCSIASLKAYPGGGAYSVSKYALLGFNDNLRDEMKPHGIKVTALVPGAVYTDSWSASGLPEERLMTVNDIAHMVYETTQLSPYAVIEKIVFRPQLGDL